jgi:hypothetical protein
MRSNNSYSGADYLDDLVLMQGSLSVTKKQDTSRCTVSVHSMHDCGTVTELSASRIASRLPFISYNTKL